MNAAHQKSLGAYYTPEPVATSLARWAVRSESDTLLDPSCGDGRFLATHSNCVGVDADPTACIAARVRVPEADIHERDFFEWASETSKRFDCAAGNPPFIRYQRFSGEVRKRSLELCAKQGVHLSSLTSSWTPFLVVASSLLKPGGRIAFVVPAEIGHASYAKPLLKYLLARFASVQIIAPRAKLFPQLSEDCWLLFAEGYGSESDHIRFTTLDSFRPMANPPKIGIEVSERDLDTWNWRLRPFLLPNDLREYYRIVAESHQAARFGDIAKIGIGYVTGGNDFFHLRPSEVAEWGIEGAFLRPTIRNGRSLRGKAITSSTLASWRKHDEKNLLLHIPVDTKPSRRVSRYLDSELGQQTREAYKCRMRDPWYSVPDVHTPHAFLSYMSGSGPQLVLNRAGCTCTNSVHSVRLLGTLSADAMLRAWHDPFTQLSCEIEGHPLGGGMLKIEPKEASRIVLRRVPPGKTDGEMIARGIAIMREWRHYG